MKFKKPITIACLIGMTLSSAYSQNDYSNLKLNIKPEKIIKSTSLNDAKLNGINLPENLSISDETINDLADQFEKERQSSLRKFQTAKAITVDTRDQNSCQDVKDTLISLNQRNTARLKDFCLIDISKPIKTIVVNEGVYKKPITWDDLTPREERLAAKTRAFATLGIGMMGLLYILPESITNWDREDIKNNGFEKWKTNVKEGPVMDKDAWYINWVGHPYSGAVYHKEARDAGFGFMQSFAFGVFMSTVVWEYGFESIAEVPSIQDLILTPVLGSLLGEAFVSWEKHIQENNGQLLGSDVAGNVAIALMNPSDALLNGINSIFEGQPFSDVNVYWISGPSSHSLNHTMPSFSDTNPNSRSSSDHFIGVGFDMKFNLF